MKQPWDHLTFDRAGEIVTRKDIEKVQPRLKYKLPPRYIDFLLARNGGMVEPRVFSIRDCKRDNHGLVHYLYPLTELMEKEKVFRRRMPTGLLPIGTDPGGNQICLACEGSGKRIGRVFFWERAFEANADEGEKVSWNNVYPIAHSLGAFFRALQDDSVL